MGHPTLKHFKIAVTLDPAQAGAVTADTVVDVLAEMPGVRAATCIETPNDVLRGDDDTLSDAIARALADGSTMAMSESLRDALHQNLFQSLRPLLALPRPH